MEKNAKIYIAGHRGMVGSAIFRHLRQNGYTNLIGKSSKELDLTRQEDVEKFFQKENPEYVFLAAAKVGGIHANATYPAAFLYDNMMISSNIIHSSYKYRVKKLLFLGSSCIYPKMSPQPIKEEHLLSSSLEPSNEAYAVAKIAGLKLCEFYKRQYGCNFISAMPCNLYGPGDNYHPENSHVIPALLKKFHEAKENQTDYVELWGTGSPLREFLHVDDLAEACFFLMNHYNETQFINVGYGSDQSIGDLANIIQEIVGFTGEIRYNTKMPDGTPRKLMDSSKITALGFQPKIDLKTGLTEVYKEFSTMEEEKKYT